MTEKQVVHHALQRLPENASLEEIAEELLIMAAVRAGVWTLLLDARRRSRRLNTYWSHRRRHGLQSNLVR